MTLNVVIAFILRYYTEFYSFAGRVAILLDHRDGILIGRRRRRRGLQSSWL